MSFMSPNILFGVDCNNCCGRFLSCNPCIMATYTGDAGDNFVSLSPHLPGKVAILNAEGVLRE